MDERQPIGPTQSVIKAQQAIQLYNDIWATRDNTQVTEEVYDIELARDNIRPQVEDQLEKIVDAQISLQLDVMRVKYGIKKKKDKKKKKKKNNEKKVKIPQGLGKINPQDLLFGLFQKGIAKRLKPANLTDFIGQHNALTYLVEKNCETMPDPSLSQIRQIVAQYIGIPLGSQVAKQKLQKWSWFLFYGAMGTGKTLITRALAKQTNSLIFDMSPEFIKDKFQDKSQFSKMLWSIIICAKEFQPSIIMIDDFQTIFPTALKGKKKESVPSFGPKMKKIIVDLKKNKYWGKNDRIAVIGCTNKPYQGSLKQMKKLFDKKIYFPYPNYATRKLLVKNFIESKINQQLTNFPYDSFANITQGFTAGSFKSCVNKVLTELRIARFKDQPLKLSQFISPLSNSVCVYSQQYEKFVKFTDEIMGFKQRREAKSKPKQQQKKQKKK